MLAPATTSRTLSSVFGRSSTNVRTPNCSQVGKKHPAQRRPDHEAERDRARSRPQRRRHRSSACSRERRDGSADERRHDRRHHARRQVDRARPARTRVCSRMAATSSEITAASAAERTPRKAAASTKTINDAETDRPSVLRRRRADPPATAPTPRMSDRPLTRSAGAVAMTAANAQRRDAQRRSRTRSGREQRPWPRSPALWPTMSPTLARNPRYS